MKFEAGQTYRVKIPAMMGTVKIHIMYVLDSHYEGEKLIVFRFYGKYKQWWHHDIDTSTQIERYIEYAKKSNKMKP